MIKLWTRAEYHTIKWYWIYWKNNCPLCDIIKWKKDNLLWKGKYWFVVHNLYPYSWNEKHLMAMPILHKKYFIDLNKNEILEYKQVHLFIKNYFWDEDYFSCNRETMWNRSIEHLHIHFIPWILKWKYLRKMLMDQWFPIVEKLD